MPRYFTISSGLRFCYLPDSAFVARVDSRRELKPLLADESERTREGLAFGGSKREVAWLAAQLWRESSPRFKGKRSPYPYCLPFGDKRGEGRHYGLFASIATRKEWEEEQAGV